MNLPIIIKREPRSERCKRGILFLTLTLGISTAIGYGLIIEPWIGLYCGLIVALTYHYTQSFARVKSVDRGMSHTYWWAVREMSFAVGIPLCAFITALAGLFYDIQTTGMIGISSFLLSSLYGAILAFLIVFLHYRALSKINPTNIERLMSLHQVDVIKIDQPFEIAYEFCKDRINSTKRHKVVKENRELGVLSIKSGVFLGHRDSNLTIFLSPDSHGTNLVVSSRPSIDTNVVDDGCNILSMRELKEALIEV